MSCSHHPSESRERSANLPSQAVAPISPWRRRVRHIFLAPVRFYRRWLSPLKGRPTCRFLPTCSEYAVEAVQTRGVLLGSLKTFARLLRCNPLFAGGYDPVSPAPVSQRILTPSKNENK